MKKSIAILFFIALITSCKKEQKKSTPEAEAKKVEQQKTTTTEHSYDFSLEKAENNITFTAYKTTEKKPVKGEFTKIEITNKCEGNTIKDAVNGATFSIPVSSIETNDSSRNFKIQKFFFGVMRNTLSLTGEITLHSETEGFLTLSMNNISEKLPFTYSIADNIFSMKTIMDVEKWNANNAISSLNEACKDLHKGKDGVSKTWNEVAIEVTSTFKK